MTDADALVQAEAHIVRLEAVVADYALRYGLTDCARVVLNLGRARAAIPERIPALQVEHRGDRLSAPQSAPQNSTRPTR